jgi:hypothetical protein
MMRGLLLLALTIWVNAPVYTQSNTLSSGGEANGTGGTVSFSVGQIDYIQSSGSGGSVNQGVQQTYSIEEENNLNELGKSIALTVGPNPSTDWLSIQSAETTDLFFFITDANGKIILEKCPLLHSQQINMQEWSQGMYFLQVTQLQTPIKQLKLIKR